MSKPPLKKASTKVDRKVRPRRKEGSFLGARPLQVLQRALGNEAFGVLQTKLTLGQPGDKYEQEADRVADAVMSMPEPSVRRQDVPKEDEEKLQTKPLAESITPLVQRQRVSKKDEEEPVEEDIQAKSLAGQLTPVTQRQGEKEKEDEEIQAKPLSGQIKTSLHRKDGTKEEEEEIRAKPLAEGAVNAKTAHHQPSVITPDLEARITAVRSTDGQPLTSSMRAFMEPRFGHDFSAVEVHAERKDSELAKALRARAFTVGHDIFFGSGQYAPSTNPGRRLIAHELTHVVQQQRKAGSAPPLRSAKPRSGESQPDRAARSAGECIHQKEETQEESLNGNKVMELEILFHEIHQLAGPRFSSESWLMQRDARYWKKWAIKMKDVQERLRAHPLYQETSAPARMMLRRLFARARKLIKELQDSDLVGIVSSGNATAAIKAGLYRLLNLYSPYYTQVHNVNLLPEIGGKRHKAFDRTCTLTSIAMALEALGLGPEDFNGSHDKLAEIATELKVEGLPVGRIEYSDLLHLRLPDFLQLVLIYEKLKGNRLTGPGLTKAHRMARERLSWDFSEVIRPMGAKCGTGGKPKKGVLTKCIESGKQVLLHARVGHYVRMQDALPKGVVIDDPWARGKNFFLTFGTMTKEYDYYFSIYR